MPNSPIQVVLHSDNFLTARDKIGGGLYKEFYDTDPPAFAAHKTAITTSLTTLKADLEHNEFSEIGFAKVVLKRSGWAKSHRPTHALFKRDVAPVVGAGGVGELFVEVSKNSIDRVLQKVAQAETNPTSRIRASAKRKSLQIKPGF